MRLLCVLKSSPFFTSFDSDFLGGGTPENESDNIKQVLFIPSESVMLAMSIIVVNQELKSSSIEALSY